MILLLYLSGVLCAAQQTVFSKKYAAAGGSPIAFNLSKIAAGILLLLLYGLITGLHFHLPSIVYGMAYGAFLCIAMHTGFIALSIGPVSLSGMIGSFSLVIPFIFGVTVLHEKLSLYGIAGMLLLPASILLLSL